MLVVLNQIQWFLDPPFFFDHDGCRHNLLDLDDSTLDELLRDAWLQFVASKVQKRKTMSDLTGLDPHLVAQCLKGKSALDTALIGSLNGGAFIGDAAHSKYDLTKQPLCDVCGVAADVSHRPECPKFSCVRNAMTDWNPGLLTASVAMKTHVLPSRSPWAVDWKNYLMRVDDSCSSFASWPSSAVQHVFSDGTKAGESPFFYAAWGCLNGQTGEPIAVGHLAGLSQTSDRAELTGALAALRWQLLGQCVMHLWLDCKFVVDGILFILEFGCCGPWANLDLWDQIAEILQQLGKERCFPHWIPSHLDPKQTECPFEDWICEMNNKVDAMINQHNHSRGSAFVDLLSSASRHHGEQLRCMNTLVRFHCAVAAQSKSEASEPPADRISQIILEANFVGDHVPDLFELYTPDLRELVSSLAWDESVAPIDFFDSSSHLDLFIV